MTFPTPYPAETRAKGWRFELDYEKVEQSDTWALAPAEVRPWLLMLWLTAWRQTPCGSLPADDALVAARIGMPAKAFQKHRDVLMRGWWPAEDGKLYHDTIIARVLEMLEYRRKNAQRVASHASKTKQSRITNALVTPDSRAINDTGTGTGTINTLSSLRSEEGVPHASPGEACKAMKSAGMASVSPSNPKLVALLDAGITLPELMDAAKHAVENGKPFAYALATAEGRRRDAATAPLPEARASPSGEPGWRRDARERMQAAVPDIAEKSALSPNQFFEVEAKNVTSLRLGREDIHKVDADLRTPVS